MLQIIPTNIRFLSRIIVESDSWYVGVPLSPKAMDWWGSFTEWCTALESASFNDYTAKGPLIVFRCRTSSFRWLLHPATGEFRDYRNKQASWAGFLTRNRSVTGELLLALAVEQ